MRFQRYIAATIQSISGLDFLIWKRWQKKATFDTMLHLNMNLEDEQRPFLYEIQQ